MPAPAGAGADTTNLIPAGLGSLRQDDIAIHVTRLAIAVKAIPLDEDFIRTLAPDSYRALARLKESKRADLDTIVRRTRLQSIDVWWVTFQSVQQGDARFSAQDIVLTNQGRDFRPLSIVPLTPGFGDQRLQQRQQATALYVFDGALNPNQSITLAVETERGGDWDSVLRRVESERARIRSRAGRGGQLLKERPSW